MSADKITIYEISNVTQPWHRDITIRYNGVYTKVDDKLIEKMYFDFEFGRRMMNDKVAFLKEAIKYEQYVEFEEVI